MTLLLFLFKESNPHQEEQTAKKRLSLTDQMGTISQQVLSKMINRKNHPTSHETSSNEILVVVGSSDGEEKSSDGSDDVDEPRMLSKLKEVKIIL